MANQYDTLSKRLFIALFTVGITSAMLVALGIGCAFWFSAREQTISKLSSILEVAMSNPMIQEDPEASRISGYLQYIGENNGFSKICLYTKDNKLSAYWTVNSEQKVCPAFVTRNGIERSWRNVRIAVPIQYKAQFAGVLYAEGIFPDLYHIVLDTIYTLLVLTLIVGSACRVAATLAMREVNFILLFAHKYLEQLKSFDQKLMPLAANKLTVESDTLGRAFVNLRDFLENSTVRRSVYENIRDWHQKIIAELVMSMRQGLGAGSPLLHKLEDYALLLQTEITHTLQPPQNFLLNQVFDNAVLAARRLYPPKKNVNVTVSLQTALRREWLGQDGLLEVLLRHLLLIAFRRTRTGLICLRVEGNLTTTFMGQTFISIILEDSGPPIQIWQLAQWLNPAQAEVPPEESIYDISWVLVGRLFRILGGEASATCNAQGGLQLKGTLPLSEPKQFIKSLLVPHKIKQSFHFTKPLALVVATHADDDNFSQLIKHTYCQAFFVESQEQALAWAAVLPFSVIIINAVMMEIEISILRSLKVLMNEDLMPTLPIWMITANTNYEEQSPWELAGIDQVFTQPVRSEDIEVACQHLMPTIHNFYLSYDIQLHNELPPRITERLPELRKEMAKQLDHLDPKLIALSQGAVPPQIIDEVHALKSVALTLGYFRVAALMAEIESAISTRDFLYTLENWSIIRECLACSGFHTHEEISGIDISLAGYCVPL